MNFFSELVSCIPSIWRWVSRKGNANLVKQWTLLNTQFVPGIIIELGNLKTRTWAPAHRLGNGCWLYCCETGREEDIPLCSCKTAQLLCVVSWSEHLLFQTRDGKATMRAFWVSGMLLRAHNLDRLWNVASQGVGLFHSKHSHMPSLQFDISALSESFKSQVRHVVCVELGT